MTNNEERLGALQDSATPTPKPADSSQPPNSISNNTINLEGLQSSEIPRDRDPKMSTNPNSHSPIGATGSIPALRNPQVAYTSKSDWSKWWIWGGIGAASVAGIILTVVVGSSILTTDAANVQTNQDVEVEPIPDRESEVTVNQGPPTDIPLLAADITRSTVLIECIEGLGSGFALDAEPLTGLPNSKLIVTNQHVIEGCEGANELIVSTATSMSKGTVIAYDASQDLAIIEAPALTAEPLSIGPVPLIGQWAMAVGNPGGITDTVTFGSITNVKLDEGFILSDVLIGPGNSGGPLVDNQGRVLGVNTAVLIAAEGFSFSVPIGNLCDQLLECK